MSEQQVRGDNQPAIRIKMLPKDTNELGTIFGGIILSQIDLAGAVEAHRWGCDRLVTAAMREVEFRTLYGTSREVADFSTLLSAFEAAGKAAVATEILEEEINGEAEPEEGGALTLDTGEAGALREGVQQSRTVTVIQQNPALERFFNVISGCLENAQIQPKTDDGG